MDTFWFSGNLPREIPRTPLFYQITLGNLGYNFVWFFRKIQLKRYLWLALNRLKNYLSKNCAVC